MALPLIPLISGLTSLVPTIAGWIGGDKAEDAAQKVADIARSATGQNDVEQAVRMVQSDPNARLKFLEMLEQQKTALDKLYLADRQDARQMYGKHNEQADKIADRITKFNVLYVMLMVVVNCMVVHFLKQNVELVAIASNLIGIVIKSLLDQVQAVTGFYFGSSLGSKAKK